MDGSVAYRESSSIRKTAGEEAALPSVSVAMAPPRPLRAQIIERRPKEHLVIPHGVQIIEQGPGQYQKKGFEGSTATDGVSAEALARIREFFGVLPATVLYR